MLDVWNVLTDLGVEILVEGEKQFTCICPLDHHEHDRTRPGFSVYRDGGRWICFKRCGQGPLVELVMKLKALPVDEATKWLFVRGADVDGDTFLKRLEPRAAGNRTANQVFWDDYQRQTADKTSKYILDRGFTVATLRNWGIRYDPLVPAIVIPIFSFTHDLVGVIRREVVTGAQWAKYAYSPGFERSKHVFGAYKHQSNTGRVVVVEGPLDCIWLHQCGVTDAVALLGVYCSEQQQRVLAHLGHRIVLALDADAAGYEASQVLERQFSEQFTVEVLEFPPGVKDAQDLSAEAIQQIFTEE